MKSHAPEIGEIVLCDVTHFFQIRQRLLLCAAVLEVIDVRLEMLLFCSKVEF